MSKTAIVTGGGRGIGLGVVRELAAAGYIVAVIGSSPAERYGEALEALREEGHEIAYFQGDLADTAASRRCAAQVAERYGRIDVLVNNAGVAPQVRADLLEMTEESFDEVLSVNLRGTFFLCQLAANAMIRMQGKGLPDYSPRIINIGSMSAYTSSVSRPEYCISKAGIAMVTQLFADRLCEYGIPVFEIRPGIIETDMTSVVHAKYEALIAQGITPIRRFGKPEDVANMVLAACSGRLDFTSGQVLNADGGFHLRRL